MFTFCSFPSELVRILILCVLLAVALFYVRRKDATAGMLIAAGAMLDIFVAFAVPVVEVAGFSAFTVNQGSSGTDWLVLIFLLVPFIPPLAQATNLVLFVVGLWRLASKLPDQELDREW